MKYFPSILFLLNILFFLSSRPAIVADVTSVDLRSAQQAYADGQMQRVPETAPPLVYVIGHLLIGHDIEDNYSVDLMINIFRRAALTGHWPFILFGEKNHPEKLRKILHRAIDNDEELKKIPYAISRCKKFLLIASGAKGFMWMRDNFSLLYNPKGGILIQNHHAELPSDFGENLFAPLKKALNKRGIDVKISDNLIQPRKSSNFGGNILALIPGLLLVGDNQDDLSPYFGADYQNRIFVPVSDLFVGHVDEVIANVKETRATKNCPREIVVAIASPKVAFNLLKNSNDPFISSDLYSTEQIFNIFKAHHLSQDLIERDVTLTHLKNKIAIRKQMATTRESELAVHKSLTGDDDNYYETQREILNLRTKISHLEVQLHNDLCKKYSNRMVYQNIFADGQEIRRINDIIQAKLDQFEEHLTAVANSIDIKITVLHLPVLYYSTEKNSDASLSLKANNLFPSPVNLIVNGNAVYYPKQFHAEFDAYIQKSFADVDIDALPIDTRSLQKYEGNLHCVSNSLHGN